MSSSKASGAQNRKRKAKEKLQDVASAKALSMFLQSQETILSEQVQQCVSSDKMIVPIKTECYIPRTGVNQELEERVMKETHSKKFKLQRSVSMAEDHQCLV